MVKKIVDKFSVSMSGNFSIRERELKSKRSDHNRMTT
jgi:hypothetical protein